MLIALVLSLPFSGPAVAMDSPTLQANQIEQMGRMVNLIQQFMGLIESTHAIAKDHEKAVILELHEIEEIYKKRGEPTQVIPVLEDVLQQTDNPTIRNVVYMKLTEAYKNSGRTDEAITVLRKALNENLKKK